MGCDLDFQSVEVQREAIAWGKWILDTTGVDGFRLDAVKHIAAWFFPQWIDAMQKHAGRELFVVGEYWTPDVGALHWYLDQLGGRLSVFGVPLHYAFRCEPRRRSTTCAGCSGPCRNATIGSSASWNHDSQPLQALESAVEPWFKPLAYAIILLREEGYPCIFYPDYYGAEYEDVGKDGQRHTVQMPSHRFLIDVFLDARRRYAWGPQYNYHDDANQVGWTRLGDELHPKAMAVLLSDGPAG
jgi:alpha-amylase